MRGRRFGHGWLLNFGTLVVELEYIDREAHRMIEWWDRCQSEGYAGVRVDGFSETEVKAIRDRITYLRPDIPVAKVTWLDFVQVGT